MTASRPQRIVAVAAGALAVDAPSDAHEDALLKIGKTRGVGTALVQRVLMEQPRPFEADVAEAASSYQ